MIINWTEIILALLGTNGITLFTSILLFKQKRKKADAEVDTSTLSNLEKGFKLQGEQLEYAQKEILEYQQSLREAYIKIQELYVEIEDLKEILKKGKVERDSLKKQLDNLGRIVNTQSNGNKPK